MLFTADLIYAFNVAAATVSPEVLYLKHQDATIEIAKNLTWKFASVGATPYKDDIESEAKKGLWEACQRFKPDRQGLACKTARKGVGDYHLHVTGVAAHAGVDFERGHSAILELARLLEKVAGFTDLRAGRTVNPGVISGGTRSNVIAAHAYADVDVRIAKAGDAAKVDKLFRGLRCSDPACKLEIAGGVNRPPMERKPGTVALYKQARKLAAELGFTLGEAATGGGSDGNFTAALGVPTLDGLGAVGEGAHAAHESVVVEHLVPRTALLAGLLAEL